MYYCFNRLQLLLHYNRFTAFWILFGTTQVSWYQKGNTYLDLLQQETVAVASAGPYANLHLDPDTYPWQHPTTHIINTAAWLHKSIGFSAWLLWTIAQEKKVRNFAMSQLECVECKKHQCSLAERQNCHPSSVWFVETVIYSSNNVHWLLPQAQ